MALPRLRMTPMLGSENWEYIPLRGYTGIVDWIYSAENIKSTFMIKGEYACTENGNQIRDSDGAIFWTLVYNLFKGTQFETEALACLLSCPE